MIYNIPDNDEFVSIEEGDDDFCSLVLWTAEGNKSVLRENLTHEDADALRNTICDTLETWAVS